MPEWITSWFYVVLLVGTAIACYWLLHGLLNPFVDASLSIIKTALLVLLKFLFLSIGWVLKPFEPLFRFLGKIWSKTFIQIITYLLIGVGIFAFDHFYALKFFDMDETMFYSFVIYGKKYWVTNLAIFFGGFFLSAAFLGLFSILVKTVMHILDQPFHIHVVVER